MVYSISGNHERRIHVAIRYVFGLPRDRIRQDRTNWNKVGMFGLGTNYNGTARNPVSFFDNVRANSGMKSVSWSYTAGNKQSELPPWRCRLSPYANKYRGRSREFDIWRL
jgi:hypothetical protein